MGSSQEAWLLLRLKRKGDECMKKLLLTLGAIALAILIFTGGMYASQLLTFTGTEQAEQTNNNSSEMLQIIKDLSADKITAEEAVEQLLAQQEASADELAAAQARVKELEDMNPSGLAKLNKELREENEQLKNTNAQLATDLNAKQKEINEKNQAYDNLQQERDGLRAEIDNLTAQFNEANNGKQSDKDEIARLEAELIKANETMAAVNAQSNADVEEARTYK